LEPLDEIFVGVGQTDYVYWIKLLIYHDCIAITMSHNQPEVHDIKSKDAHIVFSMDKNSNNGRNDNQNQQQQMISSQLTQVIRQLVGKLVGRNTSLTYSLENLEMIFQKHRA
jgi:hypothetical protein